MRINWSEQQFADVWRVDPVVASYFNRQKLRATLAYMAEKLGCKTRELTAHQRHLYRL